jgi:hypothetical protein
MALTFGVLWEIWETVFGKYIVKEKKFTEDPSIQYITWWQGSTNDIIMNIMGFYLGKTLRMCTSKRL